MQNNYSLYEEHWYLRKTRNCEPPFGSIGWLTMFLHKKKVKHEFKCQEDTSYMDLYITYKGKTRCYPGRKVGWLPGEYEGIVKMLEEKD